MSEAPGTSEESEGRDPNSGSGSDRESQEGPNRDLEDREADDREVDDREPERSGRGLLRVVFVGAVLLAGGFGYFIGAIGPQALESVAVFGVTVFRPTPVGMALYGMTVTGLVLGVFYVGARLASRRENTSKRPSNDR
jgi:uncharacterized integral membrane protein